MNLLDEYPPIADMKSHLVERVHELNAILDSKQSGDKGLMLNTIDTNIEIYESAYGEFPGKKELDLDRARVMDVKVGDFYEED